MTYKAGLGLRVTDRFEAEGVRASEVTKAHAYLGYDLSPDARMALSGGVADHNTQFSIGSVGIAYTDARAGFLRLDLERGGT